MSDPTTTPRRGDLWTIRAPGETRRVLVWRTRMGTLVVRFMDDEVSDAG